MFLITNRSNPTGPVGLLESAGFFGTEDPETPLLEPDFSDLKVQQTES